MATMYADSHTESFKTPTVALDEGFGGSRYEPLPDAPRCEETACDRVRYRLSKEVVDPRCKTHRDMELYRRAIAAEREAKGKG